MTEGKEFETLVRLVAFMEQVSHMIQIAREQGPGAALARCYFFEEEVEARLPAVAMSLLDAMEGEE